MSAFATVLGFFFLGVTGDFAAQAAGWEPHSWLLVNHTHATAVGFAVVSAGLFLLCLAALVANESKPNR